MRLGKGSLLRDLTSLMSNLIAAVCVETKVLRDVEKAREHLKWKANVICSSKWPLIFAVDTGIIW
ncbi:putative transaldolase [Trichinella pseudospiralis]